MEHVYPAGAYVYYFNPPSRVRKPVSSNYDERGVRAAAQG